MADIVEETKEQKPKKRAPSKRKPRVIDRKARKEKVQAKLEKLKHSLSAQELKVPGPSPYYIEFEDGSYYVRKRGVKKKYAKTRSMGEAFKKLEEVKNA